VQLRFKTSLTGRQYVSQSAWKNATLPRCPLHPQGGCGFVRHGTYPRVSPAGTRIARFYCPTGHRTFSLLPDFLAARLSGTLAEVEAAVAAVEAAPSLEKAADGLRPAIELPGAVRWTRHRVKPIVAALHLLKGLLPEPLAALDTTLGAFRGALGVDPVLPRLREIAAAYLHVLPPPLGFGPPHPGGGDPRARFQHEPGPDPPPLPA
jgi:hypothetical protein